MFYRLRHFLLEQMHLCVRFIDGIVSFIGKYYAFLPWNRGAPRTIQVVLYFYLEVSHTLMQLIQCWLHSSGSVAHQRVELSDKLLTKPGIRPNAPFVQMAGCEKVLPGCTLLLLSKT